MSRLTLLFDEKLYPEFRSGWDRMHFRSLLLQRISPSDVVLDFGAGRGFVSEMDFRDCARRVCGVDVDAAVLSNPHLHEARVISEAQLPYHDNTFDIAFSSCVWEHLHSPEQVLREVYRVLKPGALYIGKTPSRFHYVCLIAAATPLRFHQFVNRLRGRSERDTFPTYYRLNSRRAIRQCAEKVGFSVRDIVCTEGRPEYLRFSAATYLGGWLYERIVNSAVLWSPFRVTMTAILEKPSASEQEDIHPSLRG